MPYEKTIWKNREVERPRTFEKIENPDGTITLVPAEGNIIEPGTPIIAENMNKIEQGIKDAHDEIDAHKADYEQHTPYAIATGTNSYAVNIQGITALTEGMSVKVKFTSANTGACTLNINGLGAKEIRKSNGNSLSAGNIKAGQILHLVYTGSVFQLLGEGGEYGTAQPEHVLEGYTIGTEEGLKTGTMPNRGAVTNTITTQGGSYTIPAGYHNGSGKVIANFANLVPENIRQGVNIGGVIGSLADNKVASGITTTRFNAGTLTHPDIPFDVGRFEVALNFKPKIIFLYTWHDFSEAIANGIAIYDESISATSFKYYRYYPNFSPTNQREYKNNGVSLDGTIFYVKETGFRLPTARSGTYANAQWLAIG